MVEDDWMKEPKTVPVRTLKSELRIALLCALGVGVDKNGAMVSQRVPRDSLALAIRIGKQVMVACQPVIDEMIASGEIVEEQAVDGVKVIRLPTISDQVDDVRSKILERLRYEKGDMKIEWAIAIDRPVAVVLAAIKHLVDDGVCELYRDENQIAMMCLQQHVKMERDDRDG